MGPFGGNEMGEGVNTFKGGEFVRVWCGIA